MAKKFGKFMLFSALAGAAAAGTYYYLQRKQSEQDFSFDDSDDFDIFDEDIDDDMNASTKNRSYVSLEFENAKEKIGEKVIEAIDKTKEKVEQFNVSEKLDKAKEFVEGMTYAHASEEEDEDDEVTVEFTVIEPVSEEAVEEGTYEVPTLDLELERELAQVTTSESYTSEPQASVVEEFYDDECVED